MTSIKTGRVGRLSDYTNIVIVYLYATSDFHVQIVDRCMLEYYIVFLVDSFLARDLYVGTW